MPTPTLERLHTEIPQAQVDAFGVSNAVHRHWVAFNPEGTRDVEYGRQYGEDALRCALAREVWHALYGGGYRALRAPDSALPITKLCALLEGSSLGASEIGTKVLAHLREVPARPTDDEVARLDATFFALARDFETALDAWAEDALDLHPNPMTARERFDSGVSLVREDVDQARTLRVPIHLIESVEKYRALAAKLAREPTPAELAAETGRDLESAERVLPKLRAFAAES